jgi:hypothetical protein
LEQCFAKVKGRLRVLPHRPLQDINAKWIVNYYWRIFMNSFRALAVGAGSLLATGVSLAQNGNMMNGGTWGAGWMGGYGGIGTPILLLIVVVALVVWVARGKK